MHTSRRLLIALALSTLAPGAFAQGWPSEPTGIVVPFPPGGGMDTIARETSQRVAAATGWTCVIQKAEGVTAPRAD